MLVYFKPYRKQSKLRNMRAFFLSFLTLLSAALFAQDITPPTAICKDITIELDTWGYVAISPEDLDNGSFDDDAISSFSASQTEFYCEHLAIYEGQGPIGVTLTVTDASGNSSDCIAYVTVEDNTPPLNVGCIDFEIDIQEDGTYYIYPFYFDGGSEEGCLADIQADRTDFTCDDIGQEITVNVTFVDLSGNSSVCQSRVTVIDIAPPTPVCQDITVQLGSNGEVSIEGIDIDGGSYDNCTIASWVASQTTFDESNLGENTVTLTVTDLYDNFSECQAIVTVEPAEVTIEAVCQDFTVALSNGNAIISPEDIDGGSTGFTSAEVSTDFFDCTMIGENEVTLTISDDNGNISSCTAIVTIEGQQPSVYITASELPTLCQGNYQVLTAHSQEGVTYLWNNGATTKRINAPNGLYSVLVTNEFGCSAEAFETAIFDPTGGLASFTIIGLDEVLLKRSTVENGGVGVRKAGARAILDRSTTILASTSFVQAPKIEVKGSSLVATTYTRSTDVPLPDVMANPFNKSKNHVKIKDNQTAVLTDSIYGDIEIGKNAKVTFTQPRVYAITYWAKEKSEVKFENCANVSVLKSVKLDKESVTNPDNKTLTFVVKDNSPANEFLFGAGAQYNGRAFAPLGEIIVDKATALKPTLLTGQFLAKKVTADEFTRWNWNTNCDRACTPCANQPFEAIAATPSNARMAQPEEVEIEKSIAPAVAIAAYPNPFTDVTTIRFTSGTDGKARLSIFNISGQLVESLYEGNVEAGNEYNFQFNGSNHAAGTYFYRLETNDNVYVNKIVLTK